MPSIRRRKSSYQVQVRSEGVKLSRTFATLSDARKWARTQERRIDLGEPLPDQAGSSLKALIEQYRDSVAAFQRREENAVNLLRALLREKFVNLPLARISPSHLSKYRQQRLKTCASETVRRELGLIKTILRYASREWAIAVPYPLLAIRLPPMGRPRARRLDPAELQSIVAAASPDFRGLIEFAVETGMRRGEITRIHKSHIDADARWLTIPDTKNGEPRTIPLTSKASDIVSRRLELGADLLFPVTGRAIQARWYRLIRRVGLSDVNFHDLRHEAISRFFEMGLNVPEVALISGHRDPRMLFRYTHPRAEAVSEKIRSHATIGNQLSTGNLLSP